MAVLSLEQVTLRYGEFAAVAELSLSVPAGVIHNKGGTLGAYLADILLYLFGFSAWWWVILLLHRVRAEPSVGPPESLSW